jgi:type II secretory pathway pseudopilin PulG
MRKLNQKGFTLVEALLVIIAVALVVFVGYYVWHSQKDNNKQATETSKTSQKTSPDQSSKAKNQKYVTISEWGIKSPYSGKLNITYKLETDMAAQYVYFTTDDLEAIPDCRLNVSLGGYGNAGTITRYSLTDHVQAEDGSDLGVTPAQYITENNLPAGNYVKVGNYYYFYNHPNGPCSGTEQAQQAIADGNAIKN